MGHVRLDCSGVAANGAEYPRPEEEPIARPDAQSGICSCHFSLRLVGWTTAIVRGARAFVKRRMNTAGQMSLASLSVRQCHPTDRGRQGQGVWSDAMTSPARLTMVHSAEAQSVPAMTGRTTSHARPGPSGRSRPRAATKVTVVLGGFVTA